MADSEEQQQPQQQQEEEQEPQQQSESQPEQQQEDTATPQQEAEQGEQEGEGESSPPQEAATDQQQGEGDEGEGGGEGGGATEEEVGEKKQEKVTISHEDHPDWLTAEQCLAKGVPEDQVTAFQHTYFQLAYSIKTWCEGLSEHTFSTELISLSTTEVDVLIAASHPGHPELPDLTDEQKETLEQLEKKLNDAIEKFEGDGGFIRVNDRNPTDSVLERNDAEFVARIRDAVINELEVFKQSANAYLIWGDTEKTEGAFRRGMTRLRQSFRRQRTPSTSGRRERPNKLEDTTGQEAAEKTEAAATEQTEEEKKEETGAEGAEGEKKEEEEGEKKEGEGEGAVTVEAQVEGEGEEKEGEEQAEVAEPAPQQQEGDGEPKPEEKKSDEEEITPAAEQEAKAEAEQPKKEDLPPVRKIKSESLDNEILRAFGGAITTMYRVASGKEAMDMLLRSGVIKQYLEQLKSFGEIEGVSATISVTRFHADIARYPGMVFRGFVYEGELTALSQKHDDVTYFPNVVQYKNIIQFKIKKFFEEQIQESLVERGSYIIDLFVSTEKVYIVRLSPFYTGTGACLYTWAEHGKLLTTPPLDFKIVESARKAPDLYSGLQSHWNSMLDSVLTQKQNENRATGRQCTIL